MNKFKCTECGYIHDMTGVLEELDRNGVESITDQCPECEETQSFERGVAELDG